MLPWLEDHVGKTQEIMGNRWWQDGLQKNKHVLGKFLQYSFCQGLSNQLLASIELFPPNTLESFVV